MQAGMKEAMSESKTTKPKVGAKPAAKKGKAKPYRRPRGGDARAISDLMPEVGRAAFRRFGFVQSSIVSRWSEIVGERYAEMSAPEMIRFPMGKKSDGTLELTVAGSFAPMMQHVIPEIIERVNRFFGYAAIAKVKIKQGHVAKPEKTRTAKAAPMLKPIPMELGDSLREIADPELQTVLESLAQSLGNSEKLAKDGE